MGGQGIETIRIEFIRGTGQHPVLAKGLERGTCTVFYACQHLAISMHYGGRVGIWTYVL